MTLAKQMIDSEIRMTVHVDPVFLAHIRCVEERAIVIQMVVRHHFGKILIRGIGYVGELADRNIADVVRRVAFVSADRLWRDHVLRRRCEQRHRRLTVLGGLLFLADVVTCPRLIRPDMYLRLQTNHVKIIWESIWESSDI